jgi:CPA1 family monovalent cation:H+ antiporter
MLNIAAICLVITALLAYLNHRFVGMPTTIGVMAAALVFSLALVGLDAMGLAHGLRQYEESLLRSIDFSDVLMQGMLSLLLFAGALHVDLSELKAYRWPVGALALLGTLLSTLAVGYGMWFALPLVGLQLPLMYCLLFGALISPTDPIAVMGILKSAGAPQELELVIAGESLFNDGVGVVIFSLLLGMLTSGVTPTPAQGLQLLLHEAGGGLLFGLALGYVTFRLLKSVDSYQVEVLLTLAAVTGGYTLASTLHVSGPLAMVVAGLIIGNHGRALAMSDTTRLYLDMFWELVDEILNATLFVLIGMEVLLVVFSINELVAAGVAIAVTLLARLLTVGLPVGLLQRAFNLPRGSWKVLTWGGLRGGISVALALSLPAGAERDIVVALTYGVVVFSILAQGLSIGYVTRKAIFTASVPRCSARNCHLNRFMMSVPCE